jgi:segregation and condensation protein B
MKNDEPNQTENQNINNDQSALYDNPFYDVPDESLRSSQTENTKNPTQQSSRSEPKLVQNSESEPISDPKSTKSQSHDESSAIAESQSQTQPQLSSKESSEPLTDSKNTNGYSQQSEQLIIAEPPGLTEDEKKRRNMVLLEAALYVAGRPLGINEICSVINSRSKKRGQQLLKDLQQDFASRNTALEILELRDERYVLQLKAEFTPLVKKLVNRPLLSSGPLKTLSYIAYRQPISQKRVIEVRGQHAYGHIKMLREMDLITPERNGRSILLRTTDYFADYFGLAQDVTAMKRDLKRIFGDFPAKTAQQKQSQQQQKDEQEQ